MQEFNISLHSFQEVQEFISLATVQPFPVLVGNDVQQVARDLMNKIVTEDDELITVYYGKDVQEADAQSLTDELAEAYDDCDVEMQSGGQPLYYYLISVE